MSPLITETSHSWMEEIKSERVKRANFICLYPVQETAHTQVEINWSTASETFIYLSLFWFWCLFLKMPMFCCSSILC